MRQISPSTGHRGRFYRAVLKKECAEGHGTCFSRAGLERRRAVMCNDRDCYGWLEECSQDSVPGLLPACLVYALATLMEALERILC